ncbi:MAG: transcription elongation factor GreA [Albidovulum sp.]|nr:transcription elongation factor GreA [Albidovulum sp.]
MKKILITPEGFQSLNEEAKRLKTVSRPKVINAIAEARAHGDLSENAEYHAAREQQSLIEGRIKELESFIGRAEVITVSKLSGPIKFGATVTLENDDTLEKKTFQIVSEAEASVERGLLNIGSPLAKALIGKDEGDNAEVITPGGERSYTILEIKYV